MSESNRGASPKSRYYYDCPIKAAWMCRAFNMTFENEKGERYGTPSMVLALYAMPRPQKHLIFSDDLHLLEPQEGDKDEDGFVFAAATQTWWREYSIHAESNQPIQGGKKHSTTAKRNGKPFFWPERGEIEE